MERVVRQFIQEYTEENPGWFTRVDGQLIRFMTNEQMLDHMYDEFYNSCIGDGMLRDLIQDCLPVIAEMAGVEDEQMSAGADPKDEAFAQLSEKCLDYANSLTNEEVAEVLVRLAAKVLVDDGNDPIELLGELTKMVGHQVWEYTK